MNEVIPRLLVCICLLLTHTLSAQTILNTSNTGTKFISCDGTYQDDGAGSIYATSYDTNDDDNPDFLCWTFCPRHPINEGVRLVFTEWDVVDPGDVFRIRDGKLGACDHVTSAGLSPLIGGNSHGFTGSAASGFDGSAGGTYAYGGGAWIEASPSNESGCLTVEFRPDGDGNKGTGFTFNVECIREEGPSDLFISEFYSDCDKNMYVELYNPTNAVIDLDEEDNNFTLRRQNGTAYGTGAYEVDLHGKIQAHSTFVVCKKNSNSTITRSCDQSVDPFGNNGNLFPWRKCNEAFGLFQNGHLIDAIGDGTTTASGSGISVAGIPNVSKDYTLIRKKNVTKGNDIWANSAGTNESNSEWLLVPNGHFKNLGKHVSGNQGIFISEFSGHDADEAYIEIYNSTDAVYDLSNIDIILAKNAQDWAGNAPIGTPSYSGGWTQAGANAHILPLQGLLYPGAVYVINNLGASPSIQCQADLSLSRSNSAGQSTLQLMNGNDAIGVFMNHVLVDVVGIPGSNRAHTVDRNSSATDRFIIVRNSGIQTGNCDFTDSSAGWGEWKLQDLGDYSLLGAHNKVAEACHYSLLISEYMNDYNTTAIGITNKSTSMVDLSKFKLKMASNGQGWSANNIDFPTNTMLAPNQEFVVYQTTEADPFTAVANNLKMKTTHFIKSDGSKYLDIDDAVGLYQENGELLDIIGDQNSSNNGVGYQIAGIDNALSFNTLRRKSAIAYGNPEPMGSFGTWKTNSEWLVINNKNIEDFGMATLVDEIPGITYDLFVETEASCEGTASAKVNFELLGGTAPFAVQVDGQDVIDGSINLLNGNYLLSIVDAYGIRYNTPIEINAPLSPAITAIVQTLQAPSCASSTDASATIISEDVALTYLWADGLTTATNNQLSAGNHTVTVTNQLGCSQTLTVNIDTPNPITATASLITDLTCANATNASASVNVTGGSGTYQYAWSNGSTTATVNNLVAGTHTVTVTDNNACAVVSTVTVAQPTELSLQAALTQPNCSQATGNIQITPIGGTAPYQYSWNSAAFVQDQATLSNVVSGNYTVQIRDNNGCTYNESFVLETATTIEASIQNIKTTTCIGSNNGQAQIVTNQANAEIVWDDGIVGNLNTQLSTGNHTVTIRNSEGCSQTIEFVIEDAPAINATINLTNGLNCYGAIGASATISAQGGSGKYDFYWSNGTNGTMNSNLQAGTYTVTILDEVGCVGTETIVIEQPTALELSATIQEPTCSATPSGAIRVTATGGVAPYQYNWNNTSFTADANKTGLSGGSHSLIIKDANGCSITRDFTLAAPTNLEVAIDNITAPMCSNTNNGSAQISTGTSDLFYLWSDGSTQAINTKLASGSHSVTVSNVAGCSEVLRVDIPAPTLMTVTVNNTLAATCTSSTGQANISVTGGQGPYTYLWDNGQTTSTGTNLTTGIHQVKIIDTNGCSVDYELSIDAVSEVIETQVDAVICSGTSYATSTNNYTEPGVYTELSSTANGCDSMTTLVLSVVENANVDLGPDQIIRTGETIELVPTGNFPTYHWSTGETTASLVIQPENLIAGANTLYVTVIDEGGCEATDHIVIFYEQTTATIDPTVLKKISFYPNPSNGLLNVSDQNEELRETTIEAYTPQGQLVKSWHFDRLQTAQLDMRNLTNSVYILKIVRAEKVGFQKVLLNR